MYLHIIYTVDRYISNSYMNIWKNDIATPMNAQKVVLYLITKNMLYDGLLLICKLHSLSKFYDENQLWMKTFSSLYLHLRFFYV